MYSSGPIASSDAFFSEPTVWAAGAEFVLDANAPIPLAVFDRHCWWRDVGTEALEQTGRQWRIACLSENYASIKSSIRAGIAVGALAKSAVEASMKVLGKQQGFPVLPAISLVLLKRPNANSKVIGKMEQAIQGAVGRFGVSNL